MKKLFALLFSSLIILSVNSQPIMDDFEQVGNTNNFETPLKTNRKLQSIQATKQQLDSIVADFYNSSTNEWYAWLQTTYAYDEYGNLAEYIEYSHSNEGLIPYAKKEFAYTAEGNISQQLIYDWNSNTSAYVLHYQEDYVYNSSGALIEFVVKGTWEDKIDNTFKIEYAYDKGNLISYIRFVWENAEWVNSYKKEYIYNGTSLINEDYFLWNEINNQFDIYSRSNYYYNDDNLTKIESHNYFNSDSVKRIYEYNDQNKKTLSLTTKKEDNSDLWQMNWKTEFIYDDDMNMLAENRYTWDDELNDWKHTQERDYSFAENANLTEFVYHEGIYSDELNPQFKYTYEYNDSFSFDDLVLPSISMNNYSWPGVSYYNLNYDSIENKHMKTSHRLYWWNVNDQEWKINNHSHYYYSDKFIDGVQENITNEIIVYPNPASDFIVFETPRASYPIKVLICDIQGKTVLERDLSDSKLSIKGLKSGMYLYQVHFENSIISGKFLVE